MSRRLCAILLCAAGGLAACGCARQSAGTAATAQGVSLSPDPAYAASEIQVVFQDPWMDPNKCRFRWRSNGALISGATSRVLDPSHVRRGEKIAVEVVVEDSAQTSPQILRAEVAVVNTPPKVRTATLVMTVVSGTPTVQANVEASDADSDPVSYTFHWFKNDASMEGFSGPSVEASRFGRGDRVAIEVMAHDSESESPSFRSDVLLIDNKPPQFSSKPIAPKENDTDFRYQAVAVDPDNDPLHYELVRAPIGMIVEPNGMVVWNLPPKDQRQGDHPVRIKVSDQKGGEAVQEFSLHFDPSKQ